jgi:hypothetical protein
LSVCANCCILHRTHLIQFFVTHSQTLSSTQNKIILSFFFPFLSSMSHILHHMFLIIGLYFGLCESLHEPLNHFLTNSKLEMEVRPQSRLGCELFELNHTECGCFIDYNVAVGLFMDGTQQVRRIEE